MIAQMATSSGEYDLALRDAPPPPSAAVATVKPAREVEARERDIRTGRRSRDSNGDERAAAQPPARAPEPGQAALPRWLMLVYILIAYALCAGVLWLLSWD
jgi:hypothetical protein